MNKIFELFDKLNPLPDPAMAQEFAGIVLLLSFVVLVVAPFIAALFLLVLKSLFGIETAFTRELDRLEAEEKNKGKTQ
jgi:hypothetical protein